MSEARKLFTVEKCCCLPLETGGLIIGWFFTVVNALFVLNYLNDIATFWGAPCEKFMDDEGLKGFANVFFIEDCESVRTFSWFVIVFMLIAFSIDLIVMVLFIIGIKKHNHNLILPVIILEIIGLVLFVIRQLFSFSKLAFVGIVIIGTASIFCLVIMISLYLKFKDEKAANPQYSQAKFSGDA